MTDAEAIVDVLAELRRARERWPDWPTDPVHGAAVVAQEAGELCESALDGLYAESRTDHSMYDEAVHVAATAIRFLVGR